MMCLDMVVRNRSPFTVITPAANSNTLYLSMIIGGRGINLVRICVVAFRVVFTFNDPRLLPSISSAVIMSSLRIGQLSIARCSISTILI